MADQKFTDLTAITASAVASNDITNLVDVSVPQDKKILMSLLIDAGLLVADTATGILSRSTNTIVVSGAGGFTTTAPFTLGSTAITEAQIGVLGATAGTVTASKAVVVDSNKDATTFRNLTATNHIAGASGTAGSVQIYPTTGSKGHVAITASDASGDTTTAINVAAQAGAVTYTIPDAGTSASFVMTAGAQTLAGVKTFSSIPIFPTTGITVGTSTLTEAELGVLDGVTPGTAAASKALVLSAGSAISTITSATITTLTSTTVNATTHTAGASGTAGTINVYPTTASKGHVSLTASDASGDTTTNINVAAQTGARTLTIPDPGASASFVMTAGAQTIAGLKTFGTFSVTGEFTPGIQVAGGEAIVADSSGRGIHIYGTDYNTGVAGSGLFIQMSAATGNTNTADFYVPQTGAATYGTIRLAVLGGVMLAGATTEKVGFYGTAPIAQRSGAAQTAVATTASTQTTPWGFASQAQADAIVTLVNELRAALVALGAIKGGA